MAAVRPPVPRRAIPIPAIATEEEAATAELVDVSTRIAALAIAVSSADAKAKGYMLATPPVPPRVPAQQRSSIAVEQQGKDIGRLLARKPPPPPPPARKTSTTFDAQLCNDSDAARPPPPPPRRASRVASELIAQSSPAIDRAIPPPPPPRRASNLIPKPQTEEPEQEEYAEPSPPPLPLRRIPPAPAKDFIPEQYQECEEPVAPVPPKRRLPPPPDLSKLPPPPPIINTSSKPKRTPSIPAPQNTSSESCLKCRDFTHADTHAGYFPREGVTSLSELAYNLTSPFSSETDRARVIFTWLHFNIAYNVTDFFAGTVKGATPEETLRSGVAVCAGYAGLFRHLAELAGLEVYEVSGHGKGYGYAPLAPGQMLPLESSNHAWNCIKFDCEWHLIDPCWGAGALTNGAYNQRFDATWFHSSEEEFGRKHFPTDRSFQLLEVPQTWEEYIAAPPTLEVPSIVLQNGYDPHSIEPCTKTIPPGEYVRFRIAKLCMHMSVAPDDHYTLLVHSGNARVPLRFDYDEWAWTATFLTPMTGQVTLMYADTINGGDARGIDAGQYIGRASMTFKGLASWAIS